MTDDPNIDEVLAQLELQRDVKPAVTTSIWPAHFTPEMRDMYIKQALGYSHSSLVDMFRQHPVELPKYSTGSTRFITNVGLSVANPKRFVNISNV